MTKEQSYTSFWESGKRIWIAFLFFSFFIEKFSISFMLFSIPIVNCSCNSVRTVSDKSFSAVFYKLSGE